MAVSEQLKFVTEWENAFRRKDYEFLVNGLDKDYKTIIYPKSLGVPVLSKEEWLPGLRDVLAIWTSAKHDHHSTIETPGKIVSHFSQTATTTIGINTSFEAIKITHVGPDEEGNLKIKCIEEFVDPEAYKNTMQVIAAAKAKLNE